VKESLSEMKVSYNPGLVHAGIQKQQLRLTSKKANLCLPLDDIAPLGASGGDPVGSAGL